jgi:hypothetical protein
MVLNLGRVLEDCVNASLPACGDENEKRTGFFYHVMPIAGTVERHTLTLDAACLDRVYAVEKPIASGIASLVS